MSRQTKWERVAQELSEFNVRMRSQFHAVHGMSPAIRRWIYDTYSVAIGAREVAR